LQPATRHHADTILLRRLKLAKPVAVLLAALLTASGLGYTPASWARGGHGGGHFGGGHFGGGHFGGGHFGGRFHGHFGGPRFGWYLGPGAGLWGWGYPGPYYYPPYYYSPAVTVPVEPPVYIERGQVANNWYYCRSPAGYYPTVRSCPGGWQAVAPTN
jgi:hypothetical protein